MAWRAVAWLVVVLQVAPAPAVADDPAPGERAAGYAFAHGAAALVAMQGEDVVLERYAEGFDPGALQMLFSGSKSFSCIAAAAAVDDGLLEWDAPVERYLPEWRGTGRSGITVRNLLSLGSGLDPARGSGRDSTRTLEQSITAALEARVVAPPGRRFGYGPYPFLVFSEVLRRVTGSEADAYLARRVLAPISARAEWLPTSDGHAHFADGALMTVGDWLSFGRLVRDGGRWEGRAVVSPEAMASCFRPSSARRQYGLGWWLDVPRCTARDAGFAGSRPCAVSALGRFSSALHVVFDKDLVVVVLGDTRTDRSPGLDQRRLLRLLLDDFPGRADAPGGPARDQSSPMSMPPATSSSRSGSSAAP